MSDDIITLAEKMVGYLQHNRPIADDVIKTMTEGDSSLIDLSAVAALLVAYVAEFHALSIGVETEDELIGVIEEVIDRIKALTIVSLSEYSEG